MMRALWAGVSGLRNHQTRMDVIGNNIANVNTVGYKASRVTFQDMLSQTLQGAAGPSGTVGGTNPMQVGMGMAVASIDTVFTDGAPQATGKQTDLAISGQGFFQLSSDNGVTKTYTRDGAFDFDTEGNYVVPNTGYKVLGYQIDALGNPTGAAAPIKIDKTALMPGKESTSLTFTGNLIDSALSAVVSPSTATAPALTAVNDTTAAEALTLTGSVIETAVSGGDAAAAPLGGALGAFTIASTDATNAKNAAIAYQTAAALAVATPTAANILDASAKAKLAADAAATAVTSAQALVNEAATIGTLPAPGGLNPATTAAIANLKTAADAAALSATTAATTASSVASSAALNSARQANAAAAGAAAINTPAATAASVLAAIVADPNVSAADIAIATTAAGITSPAATAKSVAAAMALNLTTATTAAKETSNVPTSLKVYASSGTAYNLTGSFVKTGANTWDFTPIGTIADTTTGATIANVTTTPASTPVTITFNADGSYSTSTTPYTLTITPVVPPASASGPAAFTIAPDFSTMTQYESTTTAMASATDGYGAGSLDKLTISSNGTFVATYTNGITKNLAQVALFKFNNPGALEKVGGNMYVESNNSGLATKDQTSSLSPGSLEMSNVDLAQQFSDMIVTQRGFQANSKIITTTDTMLEELVNLKR